MAGVWDKYDQGSKIGIGAIGVARGPSAFWASTMPWGLPHLPVRDQADIYVCSIWCVYPHMGVGAEGDEPRSKASLLSEKRDQLQTGLVL